MTYLANEGKSLLESMRDNPDEALLKAHMAKFRAETAVVLDYSTAHPFLLNCKTRIWQNECQVVIITWVRYLGPPGRSTSQILGTFSRFSETFLAEREGGLPRGSSRTLGDPP